MVARDQRRSGVASEMAGAVPVETAFMGLLMAGVTLLAPVQSGASFVTEGMMLGFAGFLLFFIAKMSLVPTGGLGSWGPRLMRSPFKVSYVAGYLLMAAGILGMLAGLDMIS